MSSDDWFLPAMKEHWPLERCFLELERRERERLAFVEKFKEMICSVGASDKIHELKSKLETLKHTLDIRVPLLTSNQAWFESAELTQLGPFPGDLKLEPFFSYFPPIRAKSVELEIKRAWLTRSKRLRSLGSESNCLWLELLALNASYEKLCVLQVGARSWRLEQFQRQLPEALDSKSLLIFLSRIRLVLGSIRSGLDSCYEILWRQTEPFLKLQFASARCAASAPSQIVEALKFLGFDEIPSSVELKRKFKRLALIYHPDSAQGSSDKFLELHRHYRFALEQISYR